MAAQVPTSRNPQKTLRPAGLLLYGVSVSTFALAEKMKKLMNKSILNKEDIKKYLQPVFAHVKQQTQVELQVGWLPYDGLITDQNDDLLETTFIHTMWNTVTGPGFAHIFLGEDLQPQKEEVTAIDLFCKILQLGESDLDEAYKGYTLGVGMISA